MANAQSIPLYRLPVLAYENVIDMMHLKEKFNLAATSKKSSLRIRSYIHSKKHKLIIFVSGWWNLARVYVYVDRGDKSHIKESNSWKYGLGNRQNATVDPTIAQITQMASVAPTASLLLNFRDTLPEVHTALIPLAERLKLTLNSVEMDFKVVRLGDEVCRYVMENCRHARILIYQCNTSIGFYLHPNTMGSYSFDHFDFFSAPWITVNHLKQCFNNCKSIKLSSTKFSHEDMRNFLKHWVQGSKIQKLFLRYNDPDLVVTHLLHGITSVSHPRIYDRTFAHIVSPGHVIKNDEGLEAVIHSTNRSFYLTTDFDIVDATFSPEENSDKDEEENSDGED